MNHQLKMRGGSDKPLVYLQALHVWSSPCFSTWNFIMLSSKSGHRWGSTMIKHQGAYLVPTPTFDAISIFGLWVWRIYVFSCCLQFVFLNETSIWDYVILILCLASSLFHCCVLGMTCELSISTGTMEALPGEVITNNYCNFLIKFTPSKKIAA